MNDDLEELHFRWMVGDCPMVLGRIKNGDNVGGYRRFSGSG